MPPDHARKDIPPIHAELCAYCGLPAELILFGLAICLSCAARLFGEVVWTKPKGATP